MAKKHDQTKQDRSARARLRREAFASRATWSPAFLAALVVSPNVTAAAEAAGIARSWAYEFRKRDKDFAAAWDDAIEQSTDQLEEEARNRAMGKNISYKFTKDGVPLKHPLTGEPYAERCVSDTLLTLLLKAHRPEKYKDRSESTVSVTERPDFDLSKLTTEELRQWRDLQRKTRLDADPD